MSDDLMLTIGTAADLTGIRNLEKSLDVLKEKANAARAIIAPDIQEFQPQSPQQPQQPQQQLPQSPKPPKQKDLISPFEIPKRGNSILGRGGKEVLSFWDQYQDKLKQTGAVMASSLALGSGINRGVLRSLGSSLGGIGLTAGIAAHGIFDAAEATDQFNKKIINLGLDPAFAQQMIHISKLMKGGEEDAFQLQKTLKNAYLQKSKMHDYSTVVKISEITNQDATHLFDSGDAEERFKSFKRFFSGLRSDSQDAVGALMGLSETNLMILKSTAQEFSKLKENANQIALSISDRDLKAAEHLEDSLANAGAAWSKLMQPLQTESIEMFAGLAGKATSEINELQDALTRKTTSEEDNSYHNEVQIMRALNPFNNLEVFDKISESLQKDKEEDRGLFGLNLGSKFENKQDQLGEVLKSVNSRNKPQTVKNFNIAAPNINITMKENQSAPKDIAKAVQTELKSWSKQIIHNVNMHEF